MTSNLNETLEKIVEANSTIDAIKVFEAAYKHDYTTYHLLVNISGNLDNPFVRTTYPDAWVSHYLLNNFAVIDPVIERALQERESFGWHDLNPSSKARAMLKAADGFGIGRSGYSFLYEDNRGRRGLLSLNALMDTKAWIRYVGPLVDEFETILPILHSKAVSEASSEIGTPQRLTPREYECLRFSSEGNSYSEIAIILSLSEHTVRSYLKMARVKLDCVTLAQAVAKAVRTRVI